MRHTLVILIGTLAAAFCMTTMAHADALDDYVKAQMHAQAIPGLSLAVVQNGKVVAERGYGLADVERHVPATPDTVYEIGSITKQFTATAIMMLVEEGKLGLDDKISSYLSDPPAAWSGVTVRNLLTQTSGIKDYLEVGEASQQTHKSFSKEEIVKLVSDAPLLFPPGDKWAYSNTNYFLLGMILEKASGKPYGDFLEARIFKPLGMTATRADDTGIIVPNRAIGYLWDGQTLHRGGDFSMTWAFSAGAIVSTVIDMVKWDAALRTNKLLMPATLQQMWTATKLNDGGATPYGFGWLVDSVHGHRHVWHNGGVPDGFKSEIDRFIDDKLTVVILTNVFPAGTEAIAQGMAGLYVPALAPAKIIQDTDPQATQMLRDVVTGLQNGTADPARFTPEMLAVLTPQLPAISASLKPLGALKSFEPVEQTTQGTARLYKYRAVFGGTARYFVFALTNDGKVAGIRPSAE